MKQGDVVTALLKDKNGDDTYITGKIISISPNGRIFIETKSPKRAQYSVSEWQIKGVSNG
jgi:hypothetical protein